MGTESPSPQAGKPDSINTGNETIPRGEATRRLEYDLEAIKNNPSRGAQQTADLFIERTAKLRADALGQAIRQELNLMRQLWPDVRPELRATWFENARSVLGILKKSGLPAFTLTWRGNPEGVPQYAEELPPGEGARAGNNTAPPPKELPRNKESEPPSEPQKKTPPERVQDTMPDAKKKTQLPKKNKPSASPPEKKKEQRPAPPQDEKKAEKVKEAQDTLKKSLTGLVAIIQGKKKNVTEMQLIALVKAINNATTLVPFDATMLLGQLAHLKTQDGFVLHEIPAAAGGKLTLQYAAREKKWIVGRVVEAKDAPNRMRQIADELYYCLHKQPPVISPELVKSFNGVSAALATSDANYSQIVLGPLVRKFKLNIPINGNPFKVKFIGTEEEAFSVVRKKNVWTLELPKQ